jgi:predicted MFS family arabinose efflux permease
MPPRSERSIIGVLGAVQFVNILDFMMVMPMGPDFALALDIPESKLGLIGGAYTAAAAVSGLVGALFLDRFERRKALTIAMIGLVLGTIAGGFATGFGTLLLARIVAGAFGGPATSLSLSIVADVVPPERRGKAMGALFGAFAAASVLGVPLGLELAARISWQAPFFAVAAIGVVVVLGARVLLPVLDGHLKRVGTLPSPPLGEILLQPIVISSYLMTAVGMSAGFILIPNISGYLQHNLSFPRSQIGVMYLIGGVVSFFVTRLAGILVDRVGSFRVGTLGTSLLCLTTFAGFVLHPPPVPVWAVFIAFFMAMGFRNVAYQTLTSKVPKPMERARFMSIQSAVQHIASALGAGLSTLLLTQTPDRKLVGMPLVAGIMIGISMLLPVIMYLVEKQVRARVN